MEHMLEPHRENISCAYCGDAPINHKLFYYASLISIALDNHTIKVTKHAPKFLVNIVDAFLVFFFETSLFFGWAKLSDDIDKAVTFRSRVIWEEGRRRGLEMKQVIFFGRALDQYRTRINGKIFYFDSLPIPSKLLNLNQNWDDKFILKKEFEKSNIPTPKCFQFGAFYPQDLEQIFNKFEKPVIVKPRIGSRGRHTVTNIHDLEHFKKGVEVAKGLCAYLIVEEHLEGHICRATFVNGELVGFYRATPTHVIGDGKRTVRELIMERDMNRPDRVEKILVNVELENYIARSGFGLEDILPNGLRLLLSHRAGRLFGGITREMLSELHPSFVPILTKAAQLVGLPVIGFDCIVPDPTKDAHSQKWGIIECNTLPFIDLHYYALQGKPMNIAGKIWDLWQLPTINVPQ